MLQYPPARPPALGFFLSGAHTYLVVFCIPRIPILGFSLPKAALAHLLLHPIIHFSSSSSSSSSPSFSFLFVFCTTRNCLCVRACVSCMCLLSCVSLLSKVSVCSCFLHPFILPPPPHFPTLQIIDTTCLSVHHSISCHLILLLFLFLSLFLFFLLLSLQPLLCLTKLV
ncbi:uncharacterized protein BP01DRAFT_222207 [Aspergillus saccharolyticus JOP 1030-1]|uniref:Uncharacterized protein n=1 Tax=Aspergillus saccharolyticus JOP 1030-1 TaxID=1450539 RepID=A0A318Z271_9EURO|nr:hypothetical protein BP01DRAFT_222207 [Aspergillus saccharolyticus JOP 1030-1]PYH40377.1 hypothetical protein BP01DRAFT_222207 [Aspergillus saccharolyticus JOP 1030-1]